MSSPSGPSPIAQTGPHVFVDDLARPHLDDDDYHHLSRSLRLRAGDPLTISDAAGSWCTARLGGGAADLEVTGDLHVVAPPPYPIALGIALTKAAKPELAVQKATELGIDSIVVFEADHSVVRWDESKRARNQQRLARVAREAAMQSRRVTVPTVQVADSMQAAIGGRSATRADFGGDRISAAHHFVLIGPEGGWSESERERLPARVDLGATVLRAETAAIVAAAFLASARADAVSPE